MLNITPKIANSIYTILIDTVGASDEEHFRWSFCYNMTFDFPNTIPYCLQSKLVPPYQSNTKNIKRNNVIKVYDGDPIFLKVADAEEWQIEPIKNANRLIAQYLKKIKRRKKVKCLA